MPDTLDQHVLRTELSAQVELFILDLTNIPEINTIYYLTAMTDGNAGSVVFGGNTYQPYPIAIEGISRGGAGAPARPTVSVSNINKLFGVLSFLYEDLIGSSLTYIKTYAVYLGGAGAISAAPIKYTIGAKTMHTTAGVTWEMRSPLDRDRGKLPGRQMLKKDFPGLGVNKQV